MIRPTEQQRQDWEDEGYVIVEQAVAGDALKRLQAAFERCAIEARADWVKGIAEGTRSAAYFDIPNALEKDEAFINLADNPNWYGLLMDFTDGDLIFLGPQVRTLPLSPASYSWWHPDMKRPAPLHIKVQVYLDDVAPDAGAFAYVPGSHKEGAGPYPTVRNLESMPGHRLLPGKAGTAIVFNTYGWHTAMVNRTQKPRRSIILTYEKWTEGRVQPGTFASIADQLTTPERRKLFSLER
ncbi:MAG: phytanoyl-CoA dioxygenase family protein [bacterium]|nr:phytanoyl-CoA dioxygenase family protein [bacterium]